MSQYPYILFLWAFVGVALKFMWTIMTANISKEVEFVRHGIEEAAGELISRLKPRNELRVLTCAAKIGQMTEFCFLSRIGFGRWFSLRRILTQLK